MIIIIINKSPARPRGADPEGVNNSIIFILSYIIN